MLRHVAGDLPAIEVMFLRNLFGFAVLLPALVRTRDFVRTSALRLHDDVGDAILAVHPNMGSEIVLCAEDVCSVR